MTTSALQRVLVLLRKTQWEGVVTRERFPDDHDTERAYLAEASWNPNADPEKIALEQLQAACGVRCGQDLLITMHSIDDATHVWESDDEHFAFPVPALMRKYWLAGPLPGYLEVNRKNYERGWRAAQRAVAEATPEGKSYAEFWSKRMEFSVKHITAVEFERKAATAEAAHQPQREAALLEECLTSLRDGLDAYATVAKTQSDRGAIAVAVEYGYRPMKEKLTALKHEAATPAVH